MTSDQSPESPRKYCILCVFLFLSTLYLQQVRGFSAFRTGLLTMPLAIMMIVCAP